MHVLQVAYDEAQGELKNLETAALDVCRELEGAEGQSSGSSVASRLRSLGSLVTERLRGALRLGVQKTLGLTSSDYKLNFTLLLDGYVVPEDVLARKLSLRRSGRLTHPWQTMLRPSPTCLRWICSQMRPRMKLSLL
jgi:hypothetical protein